MKQHRNRLKITDTKWLLPPVILLISVSVLYIIIQNTSAAGYEQLRTKAQLNAVTYADRMMGI